MIALPSLDCTLSWRILLIVWTVKSRFCHLHVPIEKRGTMPVSCLEFTVMRAMALRSGFDWHALDFPEFAWHCSMKDTGEETT
jgi:hypothetical protein